MKRLISYLVLFLPMITSAQLANDCGENAMVINQCGAAFSITQAQMGLATIDDTCSVGGSCPIVYVNGTSYENFDCNNSTGNAAGDDFPGSIENSVWWTFVPQESCDYTVQIAISNCCCKDKGSSNSAQYQIFDADALLPGGTIQNILASASGVVGTFTPTISVTNGNPVYILLDGLNGTDCDIAVTITPQANCTGCNILPVELIEFIGVTDNDLNKLTWVTATEINNSHFIVQKSHNTVDWQDIATIPGAGNSNTPNMYEYNDKVYKSNIAYYRLLQVDFDGAVTIYDMISLKNELPNSPFKQAWNMQGEKIDTLTARGLLIYEYESGVRKKVFKK
jgi:hypothetical protein